LFTERVEPDYCATEFGGSGEEFGGGRERHAQARLDKVGFETCGEGRVCHDSGEVRHEIFGTHWSLILLT
jgi:hypothetical protein